MKEQLLRPTNYLIAFSLFLFIRYLAYYIFYNLFALLALVILYGIYSSIRSMMTKNRRATHGQYGLFLSADQARAIAKAKGKAIYQFSLASRAGWTRFKEQSSKQISDTQFFTKIIRNEPMETALRGILRLVQRDFVQGWYQSISANLDFTTYLDYILHFAVGELYSRIQNIDPTQLILVRIIGIITTHIRSVQTAERLLRAARPSNLKDPEEINRLLAQHYCQGKLHPALTATAIDTTESECIWLRKRIKSLIPFLIPRKEAENSIITVLFRELLVTCLLQPLISSFAAPDYWNQMFETYGGMLLDQQQQNRLLRKPSEYIPDFLDPNSSSSKSDPPTFDSFLRQINTCTNMVEAYSIRDKILLEIEKKGQTVAGCAPDDIINGRKVSKTHGYITQLQEALKKIDKVIVKVSEKARKDTRGDSIDGLSLSQVLEDSSLLPFFDDYLVTMGRIGLLQFWQAASNFQELIGFESALVTVEDVIDTSLIESCDYIFIAVTIRDMYEDFFSPDAGLRITNYISPAVLNSLESYIGKLTMSEPSLTTTTYGVRAVLAALSEVLIGWKEDFPTFIKHPIGQKLLSRVTVPSSNPLRFLRPSKSPDRGFLSDRTSIDSDRNTIDWDDEDHTKKRNSILGNMLKMTARLKPKGESILSMQDDPLDTVKGELHGIIHSEENSFATPKRQSKKENEVENFIKLEIEDTNSDVVLNPTETGLLPPMIILPARFSDLDVTLVKLKADFDVIERQLKDAERAANQDLAKTLAYTKRGIWFEMQEVTTEKANIERFEVDNVILPGKVSVTIGSSHVIAQNGNDYAVYPIQISRPLPDEKTSGWIVLRRYSQFLTLHQDLKSKFPLLMHSYELPGKLISGIMKRRNHFMEDRRVSLEKYLAQLLTHIEICKHQDFRRFVCHPSITRLLYGGEGKDGSPTKVSFLRNVFHTVDDTMDTIFQRRVKNSPGSASFVLPLTYSGNQVFAHNPVSTILPADSRPSLEFGSDSQASSAEPLIDLFVELFEVKGLRRQAIVIFFQNMFGDTVERRVNESLKETLTQERIIATANNIRDTYWPGGTFAIPNTIRSEDQKVRTKFDASSKINQLFPEVFGGMVGRQNARRGAMTWCKVFQNTRLNAHLMYKIVDEILTSIFPAAAIAVAERPYDL